MSYIWPIRQTLSYFIYLKKFNHHHVFWEHSLAFDFFQLRLCGGRLLKRVAAIIRWCLFDIFYINPYINSSTLITSEFCILYTQKRLDTSVFHVTMFLMGLSEIGSPVTSNKNKKKKKRNHRPISSSMKTKISYYVRVNKLRRVQPLSITTRFILTYIALDWQCAI